MNTNTAMTSPHVRASPDRSLLTTRQAADLLGISTRTLARWHALRVGPARCQIGRKVLYRASAIEAWLQANETAPVAKFNEFPQMNPILTAALDYAAQGWHVIPVHGVVDGRCTCGGATCSAGKHPIYGGGFKIATTDLQTIRDWWDANPGANVAIATGAVSDVAP